MELEEGALNDAGAPPALDTQPVTQPAETEETGAAAQGEGQQHEESIPYDRFKTVNEQLQGFKAWEPVLDMLRKQGYESPDAVIAMVSQQEQQAAVQSQLDPIAQRLMQRVEAGEIDMDAAESIWDAEKTRIAADRDRAMYADWRRGQELDQARTNFPEMDEESVITLARATGQPIAKLAQASHDRAVQIRERAIADYNAKRQQGSHIAPEGSGGAPSAPQGAPDPNKDPQGYLAWMDRVAEESRRLYR